MSVKKQSQGPSLSIAHLSFLGMDKRDKTLSCAVHQGEGSSGGRTAAVGGTAGGAVGVGAATRGARCGEAAKSGGQCGALVGAI